MISLRSLFVTICLVYFLPCAEAWGTLGHEMVGNLAWHRLTESTQTWVKELLIVTTRGSKEDPSLSPLARVADWADQIRHWKAWSAPLHFIDIRDDLIEGGCQTPEVTQDCEFQYERDCPGDVCVAGAILNFTNQLLPESSNLRGISSGKNRTQALMFLTQ
jgi:hypothetical protein